MATFAALLEPEAADDPAGISRKPISEPAAVDLSASSGDIQKRFAKVRAFESAVIMRSRLFDDLSDGCLLAAEFTPPLRNQRFEARETRISLSDRVHGLDRVGAAEP